MTDIPKAAIEAALSEYSKSHYMSPDPVGSHRRAMQAALQAATPFMNLVNLRLAARVTELEKAGTYADGIEAAWGVCKDELDKINRKNNPYDDGKAMGVKACMSAIRAIKPEVKP